MRSNPIANPLPPSTFTLVDVQTLPHDARSVIATATELAAFFKAQRLFADGIDNQEMRDLSYNLHSAMERASELMRYPRHGAPQAQNFANVLHTLWAPHFNDNFSVFDISQNCNGYGADIEPKLRAFLKLALDIAARPETERDVMRPIPTAASITGHETYHETYAARVTRRIYAFIKGAVEIARRGAVHTNSTRPILIARSTKTMEPTP